MTTSESFTLAYDLRFGSPAGPIVRSDSVTIGHSGTPWTNTAPGDALLIDGINHLLNGTDTSGDLWPGTLQWPTSQDPAAATLGLSQSTVDIAAAPLPGTAWAGLVLLGGLAAYKLTRRKGEPQVA